MLKILNKYFFLCAMMVLFGFTISAQNNAGIGTTSPHPSALLQVSDTNRGVLIPQTDTASILDYVNSLTPPSTIANGLMIYEVNLETYVFYDATAGRWKKLIDQVGPVGDEGPQGPQGPIGDKGHTTIWRDSTNTIPVLLPTDSCGSYYFNRSTGVIWKVICDANNTNLRWVDTVSADIGIGTFKAPDETITISNYSSTGNRNEPPAAGGSLITDVNFVDIDGLSHNFTVDIDEIAYVWVVAHGSVSHSFGKNNYSHVQYDIELGGAIGIRQGHPGKFYFDRDILSGGRMGNIYTIGKNGPPPAGQTFGLFDQAGWNVTAEYILEGPLTLPPPCEDFCGTLRCPAPCPPTSYAFSLKAVAGNRVSSGNVDVKLWSGPNTTNQAFMSVFVLKRRHPNAIPRKR